MQELFLLCLKEFVALCEFEPVKLFQLSNFIK